MKKGEIIKYFRVINGMTQGELGEKLGFSQNSATTRISQYEIGLRNPKEDLLKQIADVFGVSSQVFKDEVYTDEVSIMHILFSLEDTNGLTLRKTDMGYCFSFNDEISENIKLLKFIAEWREMKDKLLLGKISKDEYLMWKLRFSGNAEN